LTLCGDVRSISGTLGENENESNCNETN
jgi:hypothetical protein